MRTRLGMIIKPDANYLVFAGAEWSRGSFRGQIRLAPSPWCQGWLGGWGLGQGKYSSELCLGIIWKLFNVRDLFAPEIPIQCCSQIPREPSKVQTIGSYPQHFQIREKRLPQRQPYCLAPGMIVVQSLLGNQLSLHFKKRKLIPGKKRSEPGSYRAGETDLSTASSFFACLSLSSSFSSYIHSTNIC